MGSAVECLRQMPISKKRKKGEKKKRRERGEPPPAAPAPAETASGGGFLSSMRSGLRNVASAGGKKESWVSKLLTWAIVAAAAYFIARRFGIIR